MKNLKPLNSKQKKEIFRLLESQFGFKEKLDYIFLLNEKENKIFIVDNSISEINLDNLNVNSIGLYFGQLYKDKLRLSIEGSQLIGPKASKNILELNRQQRNAWLKGEDIEMENKEENRGFYLIKSEDDFFGTGSISNNKLFNFVPKARRVSDVS